MPDDAEQPCARLGIALPGRASFTDGTDNWNVARIVPPSHYCQSATPHQGHSFSVFIWPYCASKTSSSSEYPASFLTFALDPQLTTDTMQEPELTVAGVGHAHADSNDIHNGNATYAEHSPTAEGSNSIESPTGLGGTDTKPPISPLVATPADGAMPKAVDDVLHSDIGVNTLLNRLKQSIASARVRFSRLFEYN
jgi:hypothetical protein